MFPRTAAAGFAGRGRLSCPECGWATDCPLVLEGHWAGRHAYGPPPPLVLHVGDLPRWARRHAVDAGLVVAKWRVDWLPRLHCPAMAWKLSMKPPGRVTLMAGVAVAVERRFRREVRVGAAYFGFLLLAWAAAALA